MVPMSSGRKSARRTATKLFPGAAETLSTMLSSAKLGQEYPFLFRHPADAVEMRDWGDREIGCDQLRSPEEIAELFELELTGHRLPPSAAELFLSPSSRSGPMRSAVEASPADDEE